MPAQQRHPHRSTLGSITLSSASRPPSPHLATTQRGHLPGEPGRQRIEIYRDRPREDWPRLQDSIDMGNLPLDLNKLIEEADQEAATAGKVDPAVDIGHIHLQISDLAPPTSSITISLAWT